MLTTHLQTTTRLGDVYLTHIAPLPSGELATISTTNLYILTQPLTLQSAHPIAGSASALAALPNNLLALGTRRGTLHIFNARGASLLTLNPAGGKGISALAAHPTLPVLAMGTENTGEGVGEVIISIYELRGNAASLKCMFTESHSDSVTCLGFYGTGLLSGGADGLVNVFDLTKGEDEDEALEWVGNVRGAVNRCVWMEGGRGVGVVTTDEKFNVYDLKGGGERDWGDVRGILGAKYCVGLGEWRGGSVLLYGDNSLGTLAMADVHHLRDGERVEFPGGHGEDVVRDFVLYDDRAYTCGEDGAVRLWRF